MIRTEDAELLESAHSAVVGTVDADGLPDASRAWSIVVHPAGERLRALLPATDERTLANLRGGGAIAINMTHVLSLESLQVKGRAQSVEPATPADLERYERYVDAFAANVRQSDGTTQEQIDNLRPRELVAVEVVVEEVFDQTPGPSAGAPR